ncbi:hypothetical protein GCM10007385_35540 [Tateyamaria omphalii]|uniref:hypothetical protein n=1 Tax=Tateyamaria omphalii TaxID=299262 RepID=UPI001678F4C7|nr:hypothetical protein [Tateyamaria omphalii]GGX63300.1 hypothetical protein GCM10007385_35540 [Tateyamaria omphalii]
MDCGALEFLDEFKELTTDRSIQYTGGKQPYIGPIPAASIRSASERFGSEAASFTRCIRAMDVAYLEVVRRHPDEPTVNLSRNFGPGDLLAAGKPSGGA